MRILMTLILLQVVYPLSAEKIQQSTYTIVQDDTIAKDYPMVIPKYRLIDNGKKIMTDCKHEALYYYDADTLELKERKIPLQQFFLENPNLLNDPEGFKKKPFLHDIKDLLYYDETNQKALLLVEDSFHNRSKNTYINTFYYMTWDLQANKIVQADVIAQNRQEHYWSWEIDKKNPPVKGFTRINKPVLAVGYDPKTDTAVFMIWHWSTTYDGSSFVKNPSMLSEFVTIRKSKLESIVTLPYDKHNIGNYNFFNPATMTILAVEYWEGKFNKNGFAHIIDINSKKVLKIQTPLNTYSAIFSPDSKKVYLQSVYSDLWVADISNGKILEKFKTPSFGYIGGFVQKDQLVYANSNKNGGIKIISTAGKKLKVIKTINDKEFSGKTNPYGFLHGMPLVKKDHIYVKWDHDYAHNHILYHLIYK